MPSAGSVRKIKPDLIHAHFITKYGFHLPLLGDYPKIVTAWGDDILILPQSNRILFSFTSTSSISADLIYAVSQDIRYHIIHDFLIPEKKVHHLPFGVDTDQFSPSQDTPDEEKKKVVIYSNRNFLPIYGMDDILKGFYLALQQNPNISLILKGEGPDKERIRQEIVRIGLELHVTIRDKTEYNEVSCELKKIDIFITASGRDVLRCRCLKRCLPDFPALQPRFGGIPEWILDGENGILIPPASPEIIAQKIILLASDRKKRKILGLHARNTILERGNWAVLMKNAENDYSTLLRKDK